MTHNKRFLVGAGAMTLALALAGCGGGDSDLAATPVTPVTPAAPANPDYTVFVKQLLLTTPETTDAIAVETVTFVYADDNNATAYNDILPP